MRLYEEYECGADGYPREWHERLKHEARAAAGHRCVRCFHPYNGGEGEWSPCDERCTHGGPVRWKPALRPESDWMHRGDDLKVNEVEFMLKEVGEVQAAWRILTVHHLDGNKANCRWWNLAPLCQRCHLQIQGRVQMERVYPWPHSDWFKPYVAGYYAWTYLGEDLTREQAERRQDELLSLELA